jgi:hypothetical protein
VCCRDGELGVLRDGFEPPRLVEGRDGEAACVLRVTSWEDFCRNDELVGYGECRLTRSVSDVRRLK